MPLHPPRHLYLLQSLQEPLVVPDDVVDNAVLDALFGTHYVVAVGVALDPLVILPGVFGEDLVQAPLGHDELLGVDLHVGGLTREPADARLVQQYARVRQGVSLVLGPGGEQEGPHRGGHAEEDDAVLEEPRVDVHGPLPTRALLYDVWDDVVYAHCRSSRSWLSVAPASTGSSLSAACSSSGIVAGTAFSTRKSRAFWREISSSSNAYVPLLRRVFAISSGLFSEPSARWPISCITSSSSATIPSAVATASSTSSFLTVSSASGMTRSSKAAWSVPASS